MAFPRDEHLGVDVILPDFGYLRDKNLRAVVLTHAHEDHVGALPFLMREIRVQEIYATRLTLGLVKSKLDEHGLLRAAELREVDPERGAIELGPFRLEFIRMAHSVPDCVGIAIETSAGRVFHTGDWKLDHTPVDGLRTDVGRLAELGNRGVDLLLGDSTNAERPGFTRSERVVGEAFRQIIPSREGRVLVSSFASNIHRMQQAIDVAIDCGRKVVVVGRSMRRNMNVARNLGYVQVPDDILVKPADLDDIPPREQLILCTGSQGEPLSALTRIAYNDHPAIKVERGDTVIISARPVPGNELRVHDAINRLTKNGAEVLHEENADVHVSGHARAEELRTLLSLLRPKAVMPIHGEYRMQAAHARLAQEQGVPASSIVIAENGDVVELSRDGVRIAHHIEAGVTFVDGLGVGDLSDVALRDRRHMSEDGVLIVVTTLADGAAGTPELISRGFAENDDELFSELRTEVREILHELLDQDIAEIKLIQEHIHDGLGQVIYDRTRRRPMILPVVIEV
jgi:ribonuclease J